MGYGVFTQLVFNIFALGSNIFVLVLLGLSYVDLSKVYGFKSFIHE
jgi:hypothetical protein